MIIRVTNHVNFGTCPSLTGRLMRAERATKALVQVRDTRPDAPFKYEVLTEREYEVVKSPARLALEALCRRLNSSS